MNDVFASLIFFIVLMWLAAIGRLYVRTFLVKRLGWDDGAMVATLILSTAFCGLCVTITVLTGLKSAVDIRPDLIVPNIRMILAALLMYIVSSVFLKIALGLLLLRVLVRRWQVLTIYITLSIGIAYGIFYFFYVLFQCGNPVMFPVRIIQGQCLSRAAVDGVSYVHAILNAIADLIFLCLPVALLWNEDMTRRSKISVGAILGIGSVGGVCTVVRIAFIDTLTRPTITFLTTVHTIAIMSAAELSVGLTCICLSTYKPLLRQLFPRRFTQPSYATDARNSITLRSYHQHRISSAAANMRPDSYGDYGHYGHEHDEKTSPTSQVAPTTASSSSRY